MGLFDWFKSHKKKTENTLSDESIEKQTEAEREDYEKVQTIKDLSTPIAPDSQQSYTLREMLEMIISCNCTVSEMRLSSSMWLSWAGIIHTRLDEIYPQLISYAQNAPFSPESPEYIALADICDRVNNNLIWLKNESESRNQMELGVLIAPTQEDSFNNYYDSTRDIFNSYRFQRRYNLPICFEHSPVGEQISLTQDAEDPQVVLDKLDELIAENEKYVEVYEQELEEVKGMFPTADDSYLLLRYYPISEKNPMLIQVREDDLKALRNIRWQVYRLILNNEKKSEAAQEKNPEDKYDSLDLPLQ